MAEKSRNTGKAGAENHESVQGAEPQGPQAGVDDPKANVRLKTAEPSGSGDQGPGTRQETPQEDTLQRGQQRMHIGAGNVAAPIEAPDARSQTEPVEGHSRSSSNPVGALRGVQTYTGENHVRLTDQDGQDLDASTVFEDHSENQTFRIVKARVYEEFNYAGSEEPMTRLLYPAGHRVSLAEAARLQHATELGQAQRKQETERFQAERDRFHAPSNA